MVDSYKYLGIFFSKTSNFNKAKKHLIDQADKALHFLYTIINNIQLPIDLTLKLFDHTIVPILTYSCEVWGFSNLDLIEQIHHKFLRNVIKVKKTTPSYMIMAELGRYPLEIIINCKMIGFWLRVVKINCLLKFIQMDHTCSNHTL